MKNCIRRQLCMQEQSCKNRKNPGMFTHLYICAKNVCSVCVCLSLCVCMRDSLCACDRVDSKVHECVCMCVCVCAASVHVQLNKTFCMSAELQGILIP